MSLKDRARTAATVMAMTALGVTGVTVASAAPANADNTIVHYLSHSEVAEVRELMDGAGIACIGAGFLNPLAGIACELDRARAVDREAFDRAYHRGCGVRQETRATGSGASYDKAVTTYTAMC
ncbi:hypothetical protein FCK90_01770 [Kocuria coralli]|uniref:DUF732 domain-containing protein n=1 Tax=Kocuria coralli TaxID=1461025 RepID=A0A5J5L246_9MICC|nr:hypothetical protein [Kocuria coralli]KAA9395166.1 hypothetical protein FCK90_01770 [Kocuria coralli]